MCEQLSYSFSATHAVMEASALDELIAGGRITMDQLTSLLHEGRPALLHRLKELGVIKLPDRQKIANELSRLVRERTAPKRANMPPNSKHIPDSCCVWVEWSDGGWTAPHTFGASASSSKPMVHPLVSQITVLDNVLSNVECMKLIARAENEAGFETSRHQGKEDAAFRRGRRALLTDGGLAEEIFARIRTRLPQKPVTVDPSSASPFSSVPGWGPAAGVWEQLRVLSYESDDFFLPHRDNACKEGGSSFWPLCKSFYSILIYLADSEDGAGVTRFYCGGDAATLDQSSGDLLSQTAAASLRPTGGTVADVVPWAGRAVIFPHSLLHESMPTVKGRKFVVRSDLLFQPRSS